MVLAKCLRDVPPVTRAFAAFEQLRRRRVERIVAQGARSSSSSKAAGPLAQRLRDLVMPFVFRHVVTTKSMAWIYEHRIDWDSQVAA